MVWCFTHHPTRALSAHELATMRDGGGIHVKLIPGTFRPVINKDNDYLIDRAAQKANQTYCGVAGIAMQDAAIQESMGPIQDRSKENLVSTDNGVIMARIRLRKAALAVRAGPGARRHRSRDPCRALGVDRVARQCRLLRGRGRRAHGDGRRGAQLGVEPRHARA